MRKPSVLVPTCVLSRVTAPASAPAISARWRGANLGSGFGARDARVPASELFRDDLLQLCLDLSRVHLAVEQERAAAPAEHCGSRDERDECEHQEGRDGIERPRAPGRGDFG